jgi:hypothetical protein
MIKKEKDLDIAPSQIALNNNVPEVQVKQEIKQETGFDSETDSNCDSDAETCDEMGDDWENPLDGMDEDPNFLALTCPETANLAQEEREDEEEKKQSLIRCRDLFELLSEYTKEFPEKHE